MWQTILYGPIYLLILKIILFLFGCAKSLLLLGHFSSCGKQGLLSSYTVQAPQRGAQGPGCTGFNSYSTWAQQLQLPGSGTWLNSCSTQA